MKYRNSLTTTPAGRATRVGVELLAWEKSSPPLVENVNLVGLDVSRGVGVTGELLAIHEGESAVQSAAHHSVPDLVVTHTLGCVSAETDPDTEEASVRPVIVRHGYEESHRHCTCPSDTLQLGERGGFLALGMISKEGDELVGSVTLQLLPRSSKNDTVAPLFVDIPKAPAVTPEGMAMRLRSEPAGSVYEKRLPSLTRKRVAGTSLTSVTRTSPPWHLKPTCIVLFVDTNADVDASVQPVGTEEVWKTRTEVSSRRS